jgi:parallel beta-helix repeat protein
MKKMHGCSVLCILFASLAYGQNAQPVLQHPVASQTINQPTGTTLSVNRMENIRYAEQFANGSSTGGIQEAINDLPNGGTVVLPVGTITTTATVVVGNPVIIRGHGFNAQEALGAFGSIVNFNSASGDVFLVNASGVVMQDFTITRPAGIAASGAGVHMAGSELHMSRLQIQNQYEGILTDPGTLYLFLEDSFISGNQGDGAYIAGTARFARNRVWYNGFGPSGGNGIEVRQGGILDSEDDFMFANAGYGVYLNSGPSSTGNPSIMRGDTIDSSGNVGLLIANMTEVRFTDGWIGSSGVTFDGNHQPQYHSPFRSVDGVDVYNTTSKCRINNNQITNNGRHGILFYGAQTFEASNNQVFGNGQSGAGDGIVAVDYPGAPWQNGRIEGNRSWDAGGTVPGEHQGWGINLQGGPEDTSLCSVMISWGTIQAA